MMIFFFFLLCGLVIFHYVFDAIVAPSFRFELRLGLFEARDRIRMLKIRHGDEFSDSLFFELQDMVNRQVAILDNINILRTWQAYKIVKSESAELNRHLEKIERNLAKCNNDELSNIYARKLPLSFAKALAINSGGWLIYAAPIIFVAICMGSVVAECRRFINKVLEMPDAEFRSTFVYQLPPVNNWISTST